MVGVDQRLLLEDVDGGHAGTTGLERGDQRAVIDQARAAGVDQQRGRLHASEVVGGDDAAGGVDEAHVERDHGDRRRCVRR